MKVLKKSLCWVTVLASLSLGPAVFANDYNFSEDRNKSIGTATGKLIDVLVSDNGMSSALTKSGLRGNSATQVKQYVNVSLKALSFKNAKPTKRELYGIVRNLPKGGKDGKYRAQLLKLLNKREKDMTKGDFVDAVNSLIYLANRYGTNSATVLACAPCVSNTLSKNGFKFTMEVLENKQSKFVLENILPSDPRKLKKYISSKVRKLKMGSVSSRRSPISEEEERALGLFLALAEHGSKSQKELVEAVKQVSTSPGGKTALVDRKNPHKLWKLFSDDLTQTELEGWSKMLREVAEDANAKGEASKKAAFYRYLQKKVADDPSLEDRYKVLKEKNCFFQ